MVHDGVQLLHAAVAGAARQAQIAVEPLTRRQETVRQPSLIPRPSRRQRFPRGWGGPHLPALRDEAYEAARASACDP